VDKALCLCMKIDGQGEENPAMELARAAPSRSNETALIRAQARACSRRPRATLHVMFPMVSEPWNMKRRTRCSRAARLARRTRQDGAVGSTLRCDARRCRALAEVLDKLLPQIDFLSIGTNDLTQFLFAADRAKSAPS